MRPSVYVKVVGFRDVERHTLNTVFRLSAGRPTSYGLWTPDSPVAPHLVLVDLDAYQAGLELASPDMNPTLKMICIGKGAPAHAWRSFERPLHWPDVVAAMDELFAIATPSADSADFADFDQTIRLPPGYKLALLIDPSREDRMYLRARLSLAGHTHVDDAESAAQALELAHQRHYDLVIMSLDLPDMEGWEMVRQLVNLEPAMGRVIVTTPDKSWQMREHAEQSGCFGLFEKPYDPLQVVQMLQKI